jgi:integrase
MCESGAISDHILQRELAAVCQTAGVEGITLKDLRSLLATETADEGFPDHQIKFLLGHKLSGKEAKNHYVRNRLRKIRQNYERLFEGEFAPVVEAARQQLNQLTGNAHDHAA